MQVYILTPASLREVDLLSQVTSHPFLCEGIEEDFTLKRGEGKGDELQRLIASSGKMLLLAKLLPKLRAEGHKVQLPPRSPVA